jgi:hypothetical protein
LRWYSNMEIQSLLCGNNITNVYLWQHCNSYFVHITFFNDKKVRKNWSLHHTNFVHSVIICNEPMTNAWWGVGGESQSVFHCSESWRVLYGVSQWKKLTQMCTKLIYPLSLKYYQQAAPFSRSIYFYKLVYLFQAVPPPIIRSTKLYIKHKVLSNQYCC